MVSHNEGDVKPLLNPRSVKEHNEQSLHSFAVLSLEYFHPVGFRWKLRNTQVEAASASLRPAQPPTVLR